MASCYETRKRKNDGSVGKIEKTANGSTQGTHQTGSSLRLVTGRHGNSGSVLVYWCGGSQNQISSVRRNQKVYRMVYRMNYQMDYQMEYQMDYQMEYQIETKSKPKSKPNGMELCVVRIL
jgi:hypothetical protein